MLYIITYVTHSEGYFDILKQSSNDLIILGYGEKWIGFGYKQKQIVEFCKLKNPDDIICCIDGFDSIILSQSKKELLKKYLSYNKLLIFSKAEPHSNIMQKYFKDKLFGKCNINENLIGLNAGMYIGTAASIIECWQGIQDTDDDQAFATKVCNKYNDNNIAINNNIAIDNNNKLFYNYSHLDNIIIKDNRIVVNKRMPCIISAPGNKNINHILKKLEYSNLPKIKFNYYRRLLTYSKIFIPEILFLISIVFILYYISDKFIGALVTIILFMTFIQYELFIKHLNRPQLYKYIYILLNLFHSSIIGLLFYLFKNFECNNTKLLLLNILYLFMVFLFFIFDKCILTIIENYILNINSDYGSISNIRHLNYFFNNDSVYYPTKSNHMTDWINMNRPVIFCVILLNIYCLTKNKNLTSIINSLL